jgi:hypothetical protein
VGDDRLSSCPCWWRLVDFDKWHDPGAGEGRLPACITARSTACPPAVAALAILVPLLAVGYIGYPRAHRLHAQGG